MKLRLVCVGRMSASYLREGADDYLSRVQRYLPLEVIELKEEKTGGKTNPELVRQKEGERILQRIPPQDWVIALDEHGTLQDSVKLANLLERHMLDSTPALTAVIGGAYGLSRAVRQRADLVLSLSPLTLTHQMARLILLEQLYRGLTIIRNEPYHNA
jgi:23S rRNA (pseudouridine1915-N3)-methyltransferase